MSTKVTNIGDMVLIQTVAGFHGKAPRTYGGVEVLRTDKDGIRAEIVKQGQAVRQLKGVHLDLKEPVD